MNPSSYSFHAVPANTCLNTNLYLLPLGIMSLVIGYNGPKFNRNDHYMQANKCKR